MVDFSFFSPNITIHKTVINLNMKTNSTTNAIFAYCVLSMVPAALFALPPKQDYSDRPYGGNSGNIAGGSWTGGGVYSANIGDDVYIYTQLDANTTQGAANAHGIYGNGTSTTTAGDYLKIDVSGPDGDGIRSNPGGTTNAGSSNCTFIVGDYLTIWARGESGDCVNLNGYSTLTVGDNARFLAEGSLKSGGEGSHGLRANYASQITTGKNTYIETIGEKSHGVYAASAFFYPNAYTSSITLGDNATIVTRNSGSYGVNASNRDSTVTFKGAADISTDGAAAHAVYTNGTNSNVYFGSSTTLNTKASDAYSLYANYGKISGTGKFLIGTESGREGIYANRGTVDLKMKNGSVFNGYTSKAANGTVNIDLSDSSTWRLTDSSTLTHLGMDTSSTVIFTVSGQDDFTTVTANEAFLSDGVIKLILDGYNPVLGDAFRLIIAADFDASDLAFDFTEALLDADLYWDTSTFYEDGTVRVANVPEPVTISALFGALALGFVLRRRRRVE